MSSLSAGLRFTR